MVIGETGKIFEKRYKEHLRSFKGSNNNSKLAQNLVENGHSFEKNNIMVILHFSENAKTYECNRKIYICRENDR
jgi:hypothetical protein